MPDQSPHQGRRPHFHRGRRGPDRRGADRRATQSTAEPTTRERGDQVDVEQIMREIRARIAQRQGIDLSAQQIQELASRRLEAILEPRNINPSLLEQLRRAAGNTAVSDVPTPAVEPGYEFEETTLYDTHRGVLRFIRRLLNPILKLFFNPTPLAHALHTQAAINRAAAEQQIEQERRQAEWNALHYELLQRMVREVARVSIDMQALAARIESLSAKVDFNERRVRGMENSVHQGRPQQPRSSTPLADTPVSANGVPAENGNGENTADGATESTRRRRRRRRGRRSGSGPTDAAVTEDMTAAGDLEDADGDADTGDAGENGGDDVSDAPEVRTASQVPSPEIRTAGPVVTPAPDTPSPALEPMRDAHAVPAEPPREERTMAVPIPDHRTAPVEPVQDDRAVAFEPAHTMSPLQPLEPHPTPVEPIQPEPQRDDATPAPTPERADPGPHDR